MSDRTRIDRIEHVFEHRPMTAIAIDQLDPQRSWSDYVASSRGGVASSRGGVASSRGGVASSRGGVASSRGGVASSRSGSVLDAGSVARADLVRPIAQLARRAVPPLPVLPALATVLPQGLPRGRTVAVTNSISLLLALLGGASATGSWCALVGLPPISAEAAAEYGIDLSRLAIIPAPGPSWLTAVGALLDAVDVVVVRPPDQVSDGDIRRLSARTRSREAVLVPYLTGRIRWPRADCVLELDTGHWDGLGAGHGRLRGRRVTVRASGRGAAGRPRSASCWLPAVGGGISPDVTAVGGPGLRDLGGPDLTTSELRAG